MQDKCLHVEMSGDKKNAKQNPNWSSETYFNHLLWGVGNKGLREKNNKIKKKEEMLIIQNYEYPAYRFHNSQCIMSNTSQMQKMIAMSYFAKSLKNVNKIKKIVNRPFYFEILA